MKKFLNLALIILAVLFVTSCTTGITTAVTTESSTNNTSEPELTTKTLEVFKIAEMTEIVEITETGVIGTTAEKTTVSTTVKNTKTTTTVGNKRQTTGNGKTVTFKKGSTVLGAWIEINGKSFNDCVIVDAPMDGTITSGVIWPWKSEMKSLKVISNDEILTSSPTTTVPTTTVETIMTPTTTIETTSVTVPTTIATTTIPTTTATTISRVRTPTGVSQSKTFQAGDTVVGWKIVINGKTFEGGVVIYNSPLEGTVTDGVINPWSTEITNQTVISSNQILS